VECLRDLEGGGEEIELRQKNGVRPVVVDGLGSENLTRFLVRCGVDGGVAIPCARSEAPSFSSCQGRCTFEPALLRLLRLTAIGRVSATSIMDSSCIAMESAII
jgi:hypothetical protein